MVGSSLTGLYYHLSRYGEDLLTSTLVGAAMVFGSTLFWLIQANPTHEPSFSHNVGFAMKLPLSSSTQQKWSQNSKPERRSSF